MRTTPSLRRRRLAAELRKIREQSGSSGGEIAQQLGWQASRISRLETRQSGITAPDLRKLLNAYGVEDEGYRAYLAELARRVNERGWWQTYSGLIGSDYADLISLEAEAQVIRNYEQELVPGLLQTPDYAREVFRIARPAETSGQIDRRVEIRLERQEVLTRPAPEPPRLHVVLSEGALRRPVGGREVMSRQLDHLAHKGGQANVTVQVLPFDAGVHTSMMGSFRMMTFPEPDDPGVVSVEYATGTLFLEDASELRAYDEIWRVLQAGALSANDSAALLRSTSLGYRTREEMK